MVVRLLLRPILKIFQLNSHFPHCSITTKCRSESLPIALTIDISNRSRRHGTKEILVYLRRVLQSEQSMPSLLRRNEQRQVLWLHLDEGGMKRELGNLWRARVPHYLLLIVLQKGHVGILKRVGGSHYQPPRRRSADFQDLHSPSLYWISCRNPGTTSRLTFRNPLH